MEKKYQVFVSSTYKDLVEERQEVMQALLEQDCIPVGMELFPAADDDQWTLIKRLIDDCDYYIVIIGGRYGSINETGIGYTQQEYEYALTTGIPILGFLPKDPGKIPSEKIDIGEILIKKLNEFKLLVQKKLCKFYTSPTDLGGLVSRSLIRLIKDKPRPGWVKATLVPNEDLVRELLNSQKQIENLKAEIVKIRTNSPDTENLSQGEDICIIKYGFSDYEYHVYAKENTSDNEIKISWNDIFRIISPFMMDDGAEHELARALSKFIHKQICEVKFSENSNHDAQELRTLISKESFLQILVQFKALGLIQVSLKERDPYNSNLSYWSLTQYGEMLMERLLAIKRT